VRLRFGSVVRNVSHYQGIKAHLPDHQWLGVTYVRNSELDAMIYRILADLIFVAHFAFAIFTVLGGLLVFRWRSLLWAHLASMFWGVLIQWANWTCPLTPLESHLREMGGEGGYGGGFIDYYVSMILYPERLTLELRYLLGIVLIVVNLLVYGYLFLGKWRAA
jgi:hypothetical protein